jgi:hypothetical protein
MVRVRQHATRVTLRHPGRPHARAAAMLAALSAVALAATIHTTRPAPPPAVTTPPSAVPSASAPSAVEPSLVTPSSPSFTAPTTATPRRPSSAPPPPRPEPASRPIVERVPPNVTNTREPSPRSRSKEASRVYAHHADAGD